MATNYPGAIDTYTNPLSSEPMNAPSHAGQHANVNDAVEAIETELGTDPSGSAATVKARLDGIEDGTRLGANSVGATQIANDSVDTAAIQSKAVTAAKIADDTITAAQIAANAVGSSELADNAVDTAAIAANAVTADKIAADAVGSSEIAANAVGSSELADNAVGTAAIQDSAVTSAKIAAGTIVSSDVAADTFAAFGTVGNLLTANQASGTDTLSDTTGFTPSVGGTELVSATAYSLQGGRSLRMTTATLSSEGATCGGTVTNGTIPVTPGRVYTAVAAVYAPTAAEAVAIRVYWWTAAGNVAASTAYVDSPTVTTAASWKQISCTLTAPDNAAFASVYLRRTTGAIGSVIYWDAISLHAGASTQFSMPGQVVVGGSHIATNGAYVTSGTSVPEGVITAPPLSRYKQVSGAAVKGGAMEWVKATGTGNTGWIAGADSDTGWRQVTADNPGMFQTWTKLQVRRIGRQVHFKIRAAVGTGTAAGGTSALTLYTLPTGFTPGDYGVWGQVQVDTAGTAVAVALANIGTWAGPDILSLAAPPATWAGSVRGTAVWVTDDDWPASLPGSSV